MNWRIERELSRLLTDVGNLESTVLRRSGHIKKRINKIKELLKVEHETIGNKEESAESVLQRVQEICAGQRGDELP